MKDKDYIPFAEEEQVKKTEDPQSQSIAKSLFWSFVSATQTTVKVANTVFVTAGTAISLAYIGYQVAAVPAKVAHSTLKFVANSAIAAAPYIYRVLKPKPEVHQIEL